MTKLILVRHGEPDYSFLNQANMGNSKPEWAFLSEQGVEQSKLAASDPNLLDADILLSSPYAKTLQTAAIISDEIKLPVQGEVGLHDWVSNKTYASYRAMTKDYKKAMYEFVNKKNYENQEYESLQNVQLRVLQVLRQYLLYQKVIAVTHGGVIFSLTQEKIPYGGAIELEYEEDPKNKGKILIKQKEDLY